MSVVMLDRRGLLDRLGPSRPSGPTGPKRCCCKNKHCKRGLCKNAKPLFFIYTLEEKNKGSYCTPYCLDMAKCGRGCVRGCVRYLSLIDNF